MGPVDPLEAATPRPTLATLLLAGARLVAQRIAAGPDETTDVVLTLPRTLARPPERLVRLHFTPQPGQPDHVDLPEGTRPLALPGQPPRHLTVPVAGEDPAADTLEASWEARDLAAGSG